jgi:hypothetical protein
LLLAVLLACLFPLVVSPAQITLAWDPNKENTLAGYRVYYGYSSRNYISSVYAGNVTSCVFTELQNGSAYYFAVTAVDTSGGESGYSNEVAAIFDENGVLQTASESESFETTTESETSTSTAETAVSTGQSGGGGGCFIATAAYGSYSERHVLVLRRFRDTCLLTSRTGRAFVNWYYATSPPIADVIRENRLLKTGVRISLLPLVGFSYLCFAIGLVPALMSIVLSCALAAACVIYCRAISVRRR